MKRSPTLPTSKKDYASYYDEDADKDRWHQLWNIASHFVWRRSVKKIISHGVDVEQYSLQFNENADLYVLPSCYFYLGSKRNSIKKPLIWVELSTDDTMLAWCFGSEMRRWNHQDRYGGYSVDIYPGNDPKMVGEAWENNTEISPSALVNSF